MKKLGLIFSISLLTLFSCNKDNELDIPKTGEPFARAQNMKYYYSDESSNDLLNSENRIITPVTFEYLNDTIWYHENRTEYNDEIEKFYCMFYAWGRAGYVDHQYFVKLSENDTDTIDVKYRYSTGADGGNGFYSNIDKFYYNGILIRRGENTSSEWVPENIYILKTKGKTSISFD